MTFMGSKLQGILSKYWILLCGLMFLIISLQGTVDIFKVVYMLLFLLILNIFVISFTVFRFILRVFGWFVVLYSIAVLCMIYTYQFEDIRNQWRDGTPLTAEELKILGLQHYNDVSELLLVLLIPTAFIILVMIQLSYFHNHFLDISKISNEGYRASHLDRAEEEETGGEEGQEEGAGSREVAKVIIDDTGEDSSLHGRSSATPTPTFKQQVVKAYRYFSKFVEPVEMFLWRLLEIHMMKIVFFAIILVVTMEVTAVNGILLLLIFLPIVFESLHRLSCIISLVWISLVVVSKMLFQLEFSVLFSNSTLTKDCDQNEDFPPIGDFNITSWFGYEKVDYSFYVYVEGYVAIIVMIIIQSIVVLHQRQYRLQRGLIKPVYSIVFDDISREIADKGVFECIQYLFNYCFYKFGLEICFSTTMIVAAVRLDFIAFLYIILALPFFFVRRRTCASLWPVYTLILAILLPITYALALGLPPMLCISYPWYNVSQLPIEIVAWLYLPNYQYPLESSVIVADFFQLLFVALQWHVFRNESNGDVKTKGGDNYEVSVDVEKVEENPVPNFTFNKSYLDVAKNLIFGYMFYVTLAIVFLCATTRISILGLFYLVFAFYFLWFGPKFLTKPTPVVIKRWNLLLGYNIFVITMKVALQIVACGYESELSSSGSCWVMQLFGVTCLQNYNFDSDPVVEPCQLPADQAQLTWDVTCFFFIVFQRRIFTSNYFLYVVLDLQDEEKLASKGAELINEILATKVRNKRVEERNILEGVKRKMKRIKEKQAKLLSKKEAWQPKTHAEAIRATGGYYMFEDVDDDDLSEIEDMEAEGIIKTGEPSRKNPLQLMHHSIVEDPKRAIEIDAEHRASEGEDAEDVDADAVSYSTAISGEGADEPKVKDPKSLEEAQDDEDMVVEDDIDMEEDEPTSSKIKSTLKLTWLIFIRTIDSIIAFLDNISEEYRYVAKELSKLTSEGKRRRALRKQRRMAEMQEMKSGSSVEMQDETQEGATGEKEDTLAISTETEKAQTRDSKVTIVVPPTEHTVPQKSFPSNDDAASMTETSTSEHFQRTMPRPFRLVYAALYALIAQSQLVCYFMIILNQLLSASILSLPLPLMVFLWAMLSVPRPTKRFWITVISYTMAVVLLKYLFQFPFTHEARNVATQDKIDEAYMVIGIEKKANYAALDLCILLTVFFHRSILIRHGLWQESRVVPNLDEQGGEVAAVQTSTDISVEDVDGDETDKGKKKKKKKKKKRKKKDTATGAAESGEKPEELPTSEDDLLTSQENELQRSIRSITSHLSELEDKEPPWYQPAINFYHNMLDPMYSAVTDVYVFIFGVQFILFLIILFFSSSFGEEQGSSDVAQLISSNTIPISFLILLLVMFVLIIIDRAIYLCKDVRAKFVYLVTLVIALHIWLFFALPYYNNRLFVDNNPAQAWYFFLCIYFGLSAYQITSGYPTRILGNFLCRRYNLVSLVLFYGWRVIPFLTELRTLMDWIWTDTTLSLSHWLQVEDIYANVYPIKCFRNREIAYPVPRGTKTPRLIKYGVGGVGLLVLILIIWFPLILISLSNTTSLQNPITTASVEISFEGFEPIFKMTALSEDITQIDNEQYNKLIDRFSTDLNARSFLSIYRQEDMMVVHIKRDSTGTWDISPASRNDLIMRLQEDLSLQMSFKYSFTRITNNTQVTPTIENSYDVALSDSPDITDNLIKQLNFETDQAGTVLGLIPLFIQVPALTSPEPAGPLLPQSLDYGNATLHLSNGSVSKLSGDVEWWEASGENDTDIRLLTFNERVASELLAPLSSYGIIGLYVSLVLVIGRFVRMYFSGVSYQIMFNELPNVDRILKLCLDIYLVRESGEMELEEDLTAKLIFLYRSPETIIKVTKWKTD
ncbi:piezo-type mechanosensitive ion channel component 2-like isoform X1 [Diadema antillarum]|uniref:piezo-type mechanosensitive ion channel component 2-like isoform X1 n=1 Tax=Diadema antillarum TaxID=105358 RepID=UPI003A84B929